MYIVSNTFGRVKREHCIASLRSILNRIYLGACRSTPGSQWENHPITIWAYYEFNLQEFHCDIWSPKSSPKKKATEHQNPGYFLNIEDYTYPCYSRFFHYFINHEKGSLASQLPSGWLKIWWVLLENLPCLRSWWQNLIPCSWCSTVVGNMLIHQMVKPWLYKPSC